MSTNRDDYIEIHPDPDAPIVNPQINEGVSLLNKLLEEIIVVIERFPLEKQELVREACDKAINVYTRDQQSARYLIENVSPSSDLTGDLLDAIMFTCSHLNWLDKIDFHMSVK
jgi:hypothetical protein